jgi:hypothetical protein
VAWETDKDAPDATLWVVLVGELVADNGALAGVRVDTTFGALRIMRLDDTRAK